MIFYIVIKLKIATRHNDTQTWQSQRQEDKGFEANLSYIVSSKLIQATQIDSVLKTQ